ncbi:unnamed protein product [Diatraea saccharalis]|uniref:27 kDa hemolymph protein n=1 Tax=Diatraea saccharalis TaxID=40085 RepID=A0A9N9QWL5_9NEOP|nr:unnamed protein product [Diatraea saccharalis]
MKTIKRLDIHKSSGPDNIPPLFVKRCDCALTILLMMLFNNSLSKGVFPVVWKRARIVPIHKKGVIAELEVSEDQRQTIKNAIREQCKKNGAENKVEEIENAGKNFVDCVKGLIDIETVKQEIEEAKPKGALDEVFGKYCAKSPQFKTCIHTIVDTVAPCLETKIQEHVETIKNGTDQLIDFVCFKDGDRIALFIAEGGPECFQQKANDIKACGEKLRDSLPNVEAAKKLSLTERCGKFDELTTCIVNELEKCSNPTPGNMAESLFRFVRNGTPCKTEAPNRRAFIDSLHRKCPNQVGALTPMIM